MDNISYEIIYKNKKIVASFENKKIALEVYVKYYNHSDYQLWDNKSYQLYDNEECKRIYKINIKYS